MKCSLCEDRKWIWGNPTGEHDGICSVPCPWCQQKELEEYSRVQGKANGFSLKPNWRELVKPKPRDGTMRRKLDRLKHGTRK